MAIETPAWTRDDLVRFPNDGNRYEVLDGELLVTPQAVPNHQHIAFHLAMALHAYCDHHRLGVVMAPGAVIFEGNELQPDVEVLRPVPIGPRSRWDEFPMPLLTVEVLSPSGRSRQYDLGLKRRAYLRIGVAVYWVVDVDARRVHAWTAGAETEQIVTDILRWQPNESIAPFELAVDRLLSPTA